MMICIDNAPSKCYENSAILTETTDSFPRLLEFIPRSNTSDFEKKSASFSAKKIKLTEETHSIPCPLNNKQKSLQIPKNKNSVLEEIEIEKKQEQKPEGELAIKEFTRFCVSHLKSLGNPSEVNTMTFQKVIHLMKERGLLLLKIPNLVTEVIHINLIKFHYFLEAFKYAEAINPEDELKYLLLERTAEAYALHTDKNPTAEKFYTERATAAKKLFLDIPRRIQNEESFKQYCKEFLEPVEDESTVEPTAIQGIIELLHEEGKILLKDYPFIMQNIVHEALVTRNYFSASFEYAKAIDVRSQTRFLLMGYTAQVYSTYSKRDPAVLNFYRSAAFEAQEHFKQARAQFDWDRERKLKDK